MKEISAQEFDALKNSGTDFQLIDVREPYEREIASIGGDLIPLADIMDQADKVSRNKQVIVYCRSGKRSASAIQALEQLHGYKNLYNLAGGILAYSDDVDSSITKY
jgi:adenylyltransferase/sulfurtransferase